MKTNTLRTFIAIKLSREICAEIQKIQTHLKKTAAHVKWVKTKNIHLTLKFLGEIPSSEIDSIQQTVEKAVKNVPAFSFETTSLSTFPNHHCPRIIWLGIKEENSALSDLVSVLDGALKKFLIHQKNKKFEPHLTIGRIKSQQKIKELVTEIQTHTFEKGISQQVKSIILYKSQLTLSGPIYSIIQEHVLNVH